MKTQFVNKNTAENNWYLVDASDKILGRLASQVAKVLRGKHKPEFTPNADVGDYVVIINADKIKVTGDKKKGKIYHTHTGFPGGIKEISFEKLQKKDGTEPLEIAIKGMLPKTPLGRAMLSKLKIYAGAEHPHTAQNPQLIDLVKAE